MDRGYLDYARLYRIHLAGAFFVTRAKRNLDASRIYSEQVDKQTGIVADQSIALNGYESRKDYPSHLRRIRFHDPETGKDLVFLTNQFTLPATTILPALTIAALYKSRWQVELFLQVLSVTLFEKMPISQALQQKDYTSSLTADSNQLILFDF